MLFRSLDRLSCMAYSFIPTCPTDVDGIFLTSADVYFSRKDANLGIWFEIRAMDNAGNITRTQVPGSEVHLKSSDVLLSDDASVATKVVFQQPVYLQNNVEYAFVIHTVGINPNYYMWVSVLGEKDTIFKRPINSRALTGSLYTTNNNLDWDIVPQVDLKVNFYRAFFDTSVTGTAYMGSEAFENFKVNNATKSFSTYGETILGNDRLTLSGATITPAAGYLIVGNTTGTNSSVDAINGSVYSMSNTGYSSSEPVVIRYANGTYAGLATISTKNTSTAIVYGYSAVDSGNYLDLRWSNGVFQSNEVLTGQDSGARCNVQSIKNFVYSTVQFEPSYLSFSQTGIDFKMRCVANTGTIGGYEDITPSKLIDFDEEKINYSRSNEVGSPMNSDPSNKVKVSMSTGSEFLSPIIDMSKSYSVFVHNIINSNTTNVTASIHSELTNQYLSQVVTLAEGQDAEDLRVLITAYRPPGGNSEILVYARYSHNEDFEPITQRNWILMDYADSSVYTSIANHKDTKEYSLSLPTSVLTGTAGSTTGIAQYTNSVGTTFTGFKQFQIKIGLQSDNSAIVPRVMDVRGIALQK